MTLYSHLIMYHNLTVREREVMTQKVRLGSVRHIVVSQFCLFHSGFDLRVWCGIKTTKHPLSFHLSPRCSCYEMSSFLQEALWLRRSEAATTLLLALKQL